MPLYSFCVDTKAGSKPPLTGAHHGVCAVVLGPSSRVVALGKPETSERNKIGRVAWASGWEGVNYCKK